MIKKYYIALRETPSKYEYNVSSDFVYNLHEIRMLRIEYGNMPFLLQEVEWLVSEESLHFLLAYLAFLLLVLPPPSPAVQFCEALLRSPSLNLRGKRWLTPSPFHERLIQ